MLAATASSIDVSGYGRPSALVHRQPRADARPLPYFGEVGTGGLANGVYLRERLGYGFHVVVLPSKAALNDAGGSPLSREMGDVRRGFDRTFSRLSEVFGVSRQTLYYWMSGEKAPRDQYQARILELAAAARSFMSQQFRPTSAHLDRPIRDGKSFVQLIVEGADGAASATELVRMVERGRRDRSRLDDLLGARRAVASNERADFELPSFAEDHKRR